MARRKSDAHVDKKQRTGSSFALVIAAVEALPIAQDFLELPPQDELPDYYEVITNPISLEEIRNKDYENNTEFIEDFQLMADNAETYNDSQSGIALNATKILEFVKEQLQQKPLPKIKVRAPGFQHVTGTTTQKQKYENVLTELINFEVDGIRIGEPFLEEVNRRDYPDYHKVIKKPMALNTVKDNLVSGRIKSMGQFINQVELVFRNAQAYNEEGTLLNQDARVLQVHFEKRMEAVKREIEEQQRIQHEQQLANKKNIAPPVKLKIKPPVKMTLTPVGGDEDRENDSHSGVDEYQSEAELPAPAVSLPSTKDRTPLPVESQLIHEITIASSRSLYKQVVRPMNQAPLQMTEAWFEHRFRASDYNVPSYTLTLTRTQAAVSMSALLNQSLMKTRHQAFLTVNGERVNPVPSIHYSESGSLTSRYELKLPLGLSMVVFDVIVDNNDDQRRTVESKEKKILWVQVL